MLLFISVSPEFPIYPEGLIVPPNGRKIQELFRRNANDEGIILAEKETRPSAVYLLVVSKQYGIHFYMLPIVSGLKSDLLEEQCQKKAIALKTSLCCIGGCRANLGKHFCRACVRVSETKLLQFLFGVCACVRPDLSRP